MFRKAAPLVGGALSLIAAAFIGCTDSAVDSGSAALKASESQSSAMTASDPYSIYSVDVANINSFDEVPGLESVMTTGIERPTLDGEPTDSSRGPKNPADSGRKPRNPLDTGRKPKNPTDTGRPPQPPKNPTDTSNHPPKNPADSGRKIEPTKGPRRPGIGGELIPKSYMRAIKALNLTHEQDSLVRICFAEARKCQLDAQKSYAEARKALGEALGQAMRDLKASVDAGTTTPEAAREQAAALQTRYRNDINGLNATLLTAIGACRDELNACIRGHLTDEQAALWDSLTR